LNATHTFRYAAWPISDDGVLHPSELNLLLKDEAFGFTQTTVNKMMAMADRNHDGVIDYNEFMPTFMVLWQKSLNKEHRTAQNSSTLRK